MPWELDLEEPKNSWIVCDDCRHLSYLDEWISRDLTDELHCPVCDHKQEPPWEEIRNDVSRSTQKTRSDTN